MPDAWLKQSTLFVGICALASLGAWAQGSGSRTQSQIAGEVQHELIALPYYRVFDNLTYRIDGGAVTLLGQVTRVALKSDAEKAVKQIEGVSRVNNEIEVLPVSAADDRIRLAEYVATYGYPLLSQYAHQAVPPVHIIVKNGNVTLEGTVGNQTDKTSFFTQASGVPGVVSVTDHVKVAPPT